MGCDRLTFGEDGGGLRNESCDAWNPSLMRRTSRFDPIRQAKQCGEGYCNGDRIGVIGWNNWSTLLMTMTVPMS